MSDLYEDDILLWSEQQAELLRRWAAGEPVNDAELDWPNTAEEWPLSRAAPSWLADAIDFCQQPRRRFVPSMLQRINVPSLYADAVRALPETIDGTAPLPMPEVCPVTLEQLLAVPAGG